MISQSNARPEKLRGLPFKFNLRDAGTLIGLLIIIITFSFLSPVFFTIPNLLNILQQSSINALIALGMTPGNYLRRYRSFGWSDRCIIGGFRGNHDGSWSPRTVGHSGNAGNRGYLWRL